MYKTCLAGDRTRRPQYRVRVSHHRVRVCSGFHILRFSPASDMAGNSRQSCGQWETWDYGALDVDRLRKRAVFYAQKAGAKPETTGVASGAEHGIRLHTRRMTSEWHAEAMDSMLKSKVGQKLASLTQPQLFDTLINDAYKPKMHKIYATYLRGVKVDFALNVRKSPFQLKKIEQEVCPVYAKCALPIQYCASKHN